MNVRGRIFAAWVVFSFVLIASARADPRILWDGETHTDGTARTFGGHNAGPNDGGSARVVQSDSAHSGKSALQWDLSGKGWMMVIFNGLCPPEGAALGGHRYLTFWAKITGPQKPGIIQVRIQARKEDEGAAAHFQDVLPYCMNLADGQWHEVSVPLEEIYKPKPVGEAVTDFHLGVLALQPVDCTIWIDDIALTDTPATTRPAK